MERFCKIVGVGVKHGWLKKNPFDLYQKSYDPFDSAFLEDFELKNLETKELPTESFRIVRDIFVFSCYTGLSYVEVKNLKISDIVQGIDGKEWIMVRRQKSGTEVKLPLLKKAAQILDKYATHPHEVNDFSLLPVFSDQKMNANLKLIAKICKIKKKITFHVARHTFATTITLTNDVPLETVSKMLGHTKISTTQRYARVIEKKISHDMEQLSAKLQDGTEKNKTGKVYGHLKLV